MKEERREKWHGKTVSEDVASMPDDLDRDAVGLWQIAPRGRYDFGLEGEELIDYVRRCIQALLEAGAVPVNHEPGSGYNWHYQPQYGNSNAEIAEAVIREWLALGSNEGIDLIGEAPWFARPDPKFPKFVKMERT